MNHGWHKIAVQSARAVKPRYPPGKPGNEHWWRELDLGPWEQGKQISSSEFKHWVEVALALVRICWEASLLNHRRLQLLHQTLSRQLRLQRRCTITKKKAPVRQWILSLWTAGFAPSIQTEAFECVVLCLIRSPFPGGWEGSLRRQTRGKGPILYSVVWLRVLAPSLQYVCQISCSWGRMEQRLHATKC